MCKARDSVDSSVAEYYNHTGCKIYWRRMRKEYRYLEYSSFQRRIVELDRAEHGLS